MKRHSLALAKPYPRLPHACGFATFIAIFLAVLCPSARADNPKPDREGLEFFERRIRPVLVEHCYECHSGAAKIKGGLRLDSRDGWSRGGDSGSPIVPGKPDESLLIEAVRSDGD